MLRNSVCLVFVFLWSSLSLAESKNDYKCSVFEANHVSEKGYFSGVESWDFFIGQEFTVERNTGVIAGHQFKNNIADINPQVYDHEVNGYAVVAQSHNQVVSYLQINNFEDSVSKPFIYIMTNVILTGTCKAF